jgi:hypothetical protein
MPDLRHALLNAVIESQHEQVRKLWGDMLSGVGVKRGKGPPSGDPCNGVES